MSSDLHSTESVKERISEYIGNWFGQPGKHYGIGYMLVVLLVCSLIGFVFYLLNLAESNIVTVYILGVLMISAQTTKMRYCFISAVLAILLFNWLYAEPRFTLFYYDPRHTVTMVLLLIMSMLVAFISQQIRRRTAEQAALAVKAESELLRLNLLRSLGHDLRTPLTSISGDAEILLTRGDVLRQDSKEELYHNIYDNAEWLTTMVENVLYVTRFENGTMEIDRQPIVLSDLISESLQYISKKKQEHIILLDPTEDILLVNVDPNMIVQMLVNLINNAIKHTQVGSTIWITERQEENWAVVEVADNGPGIANQEAIFNIFYSTASTELQPDEKRGMGLGLPLSKSIIEMHDGELYYKKNIPHGAIFGFQLPVERTEDLHDNNFGN